jgi:hypothetical protein
MDKGEHLTDAGFDECVRLAENLRVKRRPVAQIDKGRVQLLPTHTVSCHGSVLCTDLKERRLTERNSLAHNWCPARMAS